ncbi:MAG: carbohydrate ABC transporter permease [Ruminococcus sp.]|nr:carbohydrate ABC transporter permease [Ruminococcus sp.]
MKQKSIRYKLSEWMLFLFLGAGALLFLMPLVLTVCDSFMTETEIFYNYGAMLSLKSDTIYTADSVSLKLIPDRVTLQQYANVLITNSEYLLKFWNSVILTIPVTMLQIGIALLASYGFARYEGRVKQIVFLVYIILMLMPYQVTLVPNFLVADALGFAGSRWAVILPGIFSTFPVYLFTRIMKRIPKAYLEAARLDGAGELQIFLHIAVPLCRNVIVSVLLLVFIDCWNMVEQPLLMIDDPQKQPLSIFLAQIRTGDLGIAFAAAVFYMIPSLLLFLYGEEDLVQGMAYAGVKT